ncbi:hypothetical protein HWV62_12904 [Athelia sp. TMB]|nr:hypothetical protein HWV62_12904 [Athelia sp. TMB]
MQIANPRPQAGEVIFSPDSILDVVGCLIPDIAQCRVLWPDREALRTHIRGKVEDAFDVLLAHHARTYFHYIRLATKEAGVPPAVVSEALGSAVHARDLLLEGVMARRYFTYVLFDVEKSKDIGDRYTMRVASAAGATLLDRHDDCEVKYRTYMSDLPALLRSMPNHASAHQHDSPSDLADDLSSMQLGPSEGSSRPVWVG